MRGAGVREGVVWGDPGGCAGGENAVQRENRKEGEEEHCVAGGDVEEEKKRNGSTNAGTYTSVVLAHTGVDKKAGP